jgi:hypothetical protein
MDGEADIDTASMEKATFGAKVDEEILTMVASKSPNRGKRDSPQSVDQSHEIWAWIEYKVAKSVH